MHTVHHRHGHHAQNYGLPLWDMLFGTWTNPAERAQKLGFDEDKSERVAEMLLWRDVHLSGPACGRKNRTAPAKLIANCVDGCSETHCFVLNC